MLPSLSKLAPLAQHGSALLPSAWHAAHVLAPSMAGASIGSGRLAQPLAPPGGVVCGAAWYSVQVLVPSMGDSISEGSISAVFKQAGESVQENETIAQVGACWPWRGKGVAVPACWQHGTA